MKIFAQICAGLAHIHAQRILHRDIKSHNIFMNKEHEIRIGDFGVAKQLHDQVDFAATLVGTPFYVSPEICAKREYDFKSDMWGLGCILYEMCERKVPFKSSKNNVLFRKIRKGSVESLAAKFAYSGRKWSNNQANLNRFRRNIRPD